MKYWGYLVQHNFHEKSDVDIHNTGRYKVHVYVIILKGNLT